MPNKVNFIHSDVRFIVTILCFTSKEITSFSINRSFLYDLIARGDVFQHAIFEPQEIETALHHLFVGGFITFSNSRVKLRPVLSDLIYQAKKRSGTAAQMNFLAKTLNSSSGRPLKFRARYFPIREYKIAVTKYLKLTEELLTNTTKGTSS